jgi:Enoyl-(Acyl carrier protein) reductase
MPQSTASSTSSPASSTSSPTPSAVLHPLKNKDDASSAVAKVRRADESFTWPVMGLSPPADDPHPAATSGLHCGSPIWRGTKGLRLVLLRNGSWIRRSRRRWHLEAQRQHPQPRGLLAAEFGPQAVRVNAILPGAVDTDMYRTMNDTPESQAFMTNLHALKRVATPEEIARSVLYLASDDSAFVTGTASLVDGGASIART